MPSPPPNRLNYLVQLMQRAIAKKITQEQYWAEIARYEYTEEDLQAALNQFKAIASEQATMQDKRVAPRETVTDPIAGPSSTPDWALSSEVHALGQKIAEVSTRFKQQITYVPERSLKSIRVKRLFFAPEPDTDLGKIPPLRHNFVGHAGLQATASILIVPGGVEIHDPLTGNEWERPEFKRYMQPLLTEEEKTFPEHGFSCKVGLDLDGNPLRKHNIIGLMVSGRKGSGKSQFLRQLTSELCLKHKPQHLKLALFDIQGSTFLGFEHSRWNFQPPCSDEHSYEAAMEALLAEAKRRENLFRQERVSSIEQWNRIYPQNPLCRIVVIVDEFGETVSRLGVKKTNHAPASLSRANRKHGFDLVLATPTPDKNDFHPDLLRGLPDRIVFQAADIGASYVAFGYNEDAGVFLLGKGDGFLKAGNTPIRFQGFWMGEDDGASQIEKINAWGDHLYGPPEKVSDPWEEPCATA